MKKYRPMEALEMLHKYVHISDVINEFLNGDSKHAGEYRAACPFCGCDGDGLKSLFYNDYSNLYKCVHCGEHGDAISFLMKFQKMDFAAALRWLLRHWEIDCPELEEDLIVRGSKADLRTQAAIAMLPAMTRRIISDEGGGQHYATAQEAASEALARADALVEEFFKEGGES